MAANRKQRRKDRTPGSRQGQPRPAGPASGASQSAAARTDARATRAAKLQKDGAFDAAAEVWRDILADRPDDLNALQHLGVLQLQHPAGELDTAVKLLTRAADLLPGSAPAQMHAGLAMLRAGQLQQALSRLEQAVAIKPDYAEAHNNLGVAFKELERFEDAGASFQAAVRLKPDYGEATRNLEGLKNLLQADTQTRRRAEALVQANRHGEAAELYRTLVQKRPTHAKLRYALADNLRKDLQYDAANAELDAILAHDPTQQRVYLARGMIAHDRAEFEACLGELDQISPDHEVYPQTHRLRANALSSLRRYDEARVVFEQALAADPDNAEIHNDYGMMLVSLNRTSEASVQLLQAIRLDPSSQNYNNLGNLLKDQGRMLDALELYEESLARVGPSPLLASNLAFVLNYINGLSNAAIYDGHLRFREAVAHITPQRKHPNDPTPDRRLRVGMMSPDLRAHSVARFLMPLLRAYDRTAIELSLFANVPKPDKVTATMRQLCDHWQDIRKMPAEQVADLVRAERIDVLIDLAGHTGGNSLEVFQHKPAPVQASWLGYPNTTGLETMDYRIVDELVEPSGAAEPYSSEKIVRLPDGFHCFEPPNPCPPVSDLPSAQNGFVRFGSFNYLGKVNEQVIELWSAILKRVPNSRLLLKARGLGDPLSNRAYLQLFEDQGVARERVEIVSYQPSIQEHLELYQAIDIALDTYPYNGTTTTCEALWMGVPTIALLGPTHAARVSASLLHQIGLDDLIAESPADYVDRAVALAQNPDRMAELRQGMRARINASPLRDESGFARKFETALRDIWTTWCREGARGDDRSSVATGVAAMAGGAAWHPGSVKAPDEIRVIHNLARTGGTLIAKCLGSMDGVVLLSEAHPNGAAWIDPINQAQQWFGLIDAKEAELIRVEDDPFQVLIALCAARCEAKGQTLLVRDWTHLDFTGVPFQTPHYELTTRDCLAGRFENVLSTATVRHPIDEWLSLDKLALVRGRLTIDAYMRGYREFAEVAREIGFLRYEDFTHDPDGCLETLCARLKIPFDAGYATRWADYGLITGDVRRDGAPQRDIRPVCLRQYDPDLLRAFEACPDFAPALDLLGYPTCEASRSAS